MDGRGENPSKIIDIEYRQMCKIHETVLKNKLLGICIPVLWVPLAPPKWWHEVLLGPSLNELAQRDPNYSRQETKSISTGPSGAIRL